MHFIKYYSNIKITIIYIYIYIKFIIILLNFVLAGWLALPIDSNGSPGPLSPSENLTFLIKKPLTCKDKGAPWRPFALRRSSQYKGKETPSV